MDKVKVYAVCASKWNSFWLSVGGGRWCDAVTQNYLVTFLCTKNSEYTLGFAHNVFINFHKIDQGH